MERIRPLSTAETFEHLKALHFLPDDDAILALYDSLEPVRSNDILGKWRGGGFDTGHWLLSALIDLKWFGKWFVSKTDVKPLVCYDGNGDLHSSLAMNGEATLLMRRFRGKLSAAVAYNGVPMFGHLRRVDDTTLLGVVDGDVLPDGADLVPRGRHQVFYLERIEDWPAPFVALNAGLRSLISPGSNGPTLLDR